MFEQLKQCRQLIKEHEEIRGNICRISKLIVEFVNLADLKHISSDFTSPQINFLNSKRINLRHNMISFIEELQIHCQREEETLRRATGLRLWQNVKIQQGRVYKAFSDIEATILSLSPVGMLFNSDYLKSKVDNTCQTLSELICQEDSLLELSESNRKHEFSQTH